MLEKEARRGAETIKERYSTKYRKEPLTVAGLGSLA